MRRNSEADTIRREKLIAYRKNMGLTLEQVGKELGITYPAYSLIENGKSASMKLWRKIQYFFQIPSSEMWEIINPDLEEV